MKLGLLVILLSLTTLTQAQSFWKVLPEPQPRFNLTIIGDSAIISQPSTSKIKMTAFRPILNVGSISIPEGAVLTGAGVAHEHLVWEDKKWKNKWAIVALIWYKKSLEDKKTNFLSLGLGFAWKNILTGANTNFKSLQGTLGYLINFNN